MSVGRPRPALDSLPVYRPGKAASQAEAEHGISNAIKLASNENPYQPVAAVEKAVAEAIGGVNRYGDHRAGQLRAKLADWIGVDQAQITVGCGSVGLLRQIVLVYVDAGDEVVYPWPSFEAYPISVEMMGGRPVTVPLIDNGFDLDAVAAAVTDRTKLVLLATPNNPTGTAVSVDQLRSLMESIPDHVVVLIDEAYREFADPGLGDPVTELLPTYRNLIVTRTFSKAHGLAGLRTGYAIADPEIIDDLDKVLLAFTVNSLAQAGALAAIDAEADVRVNIERLVAERSRVVTALTDAGWKLPDAQANFVYIPMGDRTDEIYLALEKAGVVTRPFPGDGLRVTIGTPEENDRFLRTLAEVATP